MINEFNPNVIFCNVQTGDLILVDQSEVAGRHAFLFNTKGDIGFIKAVDLMNNYSLIDQL